MLAVLFTRRWLTAVLVAVLFFVACLFLGRWQFHRYEDRRQQVDLVEAYYDAAPIPLSQVLPPGAQSLPDDEVWRRVEAVGTYDQDAQHMVRNRPQNVTYGFEVLVPLQLPEGDAVLVDRGWVQNAERADVVPEVPPAPEGQVRVVGWLRQGEPSLARPMPEGQLASIDLAEAAQLTGHTLRGAYVLLDAEDVGDGTTPPRPQPLLPPVTDTGPHLAYALQWWGTSIAGFILVFVYARREYRDSLPEDDPRRAKNPAPKRVRIWDEEDG